MTKYSAKIPAWAISIVMLILITSALYAGPFDEDSDDFSSFLVITGYEEDGSFGEPASLALDDRAGLICITDTKAGKALLLNLQGSPKNQYGEACELLTPSGVVIGKNGDLLVSDSSGGPVRIIPANGGLNKLELPCDEGDRPPMPGRMTFDRDGNLYVVDTANSRVCVFDKTMKLKFKFGRKGTKRGEFTAIQDVAVDRQGRIYVADSQGTPVQVYDKKGKYLFKFGFNGSGNEDISFASGIFVDLNDQIWVVDRGQHALKVFDRLGSFLRSFGTYGTGQGSLFQPVDADIDTFGRVYVLEAGARRLQVFMLKNPFARFTPRGL
ncbi:MAG: NHL repeat-containing protein [Armatimonadota bacterium]